jgi:hypothetical protein
MQTFLPLASFETSARILDNQRLGKQRVEGLQIFNALTLNKQSRWRNHPATLMWKGYEPMLVNYIRAICDEWTSRGYKDTVKEKVRLMAKEHGLSETEIKYADKPWWLNKRQFHASHRSNLIRKMPERYGKLWPDHEEDLDYWWPVRIKK